MATDEPEAPRGEGDDGTEEGSPFILVAQFFVIPLAVVVLAVAIFTLFGLFTREKHTPGEYLDEVVRGSLNRRWQAAYEFSTVLGNRPELRQDEELFRKTLRVFEAVDEAEVRRYLALALGRFGRPAAVPALAAALGDEDEETRLYATIALSSIKDGAAVGPLIELLHADEPTLRKAAAFALGHIGDARAIEPLRPVAEDRLFDVGLQAAVALAQLGDGHGREVMRRALDRATFAELELGAPEHKMNDPQQAEAMINGITGLVLVGDTDSLARLKALATDDPNLRVRDAALKAIEKLAP